MQTFSIPLPNVHIPRYDWRMVLVIWNPIGKKLLGFGMAWEINTLQEKTTLRPEYFEIEQTPNQTKV